jgi:hypothetical protein
VQHGSPQPISASPVVSKNLMARRTVKSRANRASDEAVSAAAPRKTTVASDDQGYSVLPQLCHIPKFPFQNVNPFPKRNLNFLKDFIYFHLK